jgi:quercetin dioxygenase-like cupin family protein
VRRRVVKQKEADYDFHLFGIHDNLLLSKSTTQDHWGLTKVEFLMNMPINHFNSKPEVNLTDEIMATQLVESGAQGELSAHKIWIPADTEYPPHTHPSPHIIIILEGRGYLRCGQDKNEIYYPIGTGDVFHVPENIRHQVGADSTGMIMIAISVGSKPIIDPDRLRVLPK